MSPHTPSSARVTLFPPAVRPSDVIRVIAPSSPFDPPLLWRALGWLAERYSVRFSRAIFTRHGYLAGSDERRSEELRQALMEQGVRAIVVARGGYGLSRIVHAVDWSMLRRHPRWITGFSDVTALHVEAAKQGVASLHCSNLTALGRADATARSSFIAALETPIRQRCWNGLRVLHHGCAAGTLFGGNLALLHASAAAGRLHIPLGSVLFFEDIGERPYRIDRMLTTLAVGGHFDRIVAVVAGQFTDCTPGLDGTTVAEVVSDCFTRYSVPVLFGAPVGHGRQNEPMVLGGSAEVFADGQAGRVLLGG